MAEEKKAQAAQTADAEGKASISEKLKAAEGNINRAALDAKVRKNEQEKSLKRTESEAKARLEESERARLESERAARLVAEQKMAAFEYAENYRKKLMRDKQRTVSAAKQRAMEEKAAAEAEQKRAREAEIAAILEKERNEARERGNRATALLNRVTKLAVVDGDGNLRIVDKNEAADIKRTQTSAGTEAPKVEEKVKATEKPAETFNKPDGRIFVTEDSFGMYPEKSYFDDDIVTEQDGRLLLNISDNRMMVEVSDGNEAEEAREYERYIAAQAASAEAYNKEMKRMMDSYASMLNPKPVKQEAPAKTETKASEPAVVAVAEDIAPEKVSAPIEKIAAEPEIVEAPIVALAVDISEDEKSAEDAAEPSAEQTAEDMEESAAVETAEKEKKEKKKRAANAKEEAVQSEEEDGKEVEATVAIDEGIVAELRAISERVTGVKSLKRYLAKLNKAVKKMRREISRLDKKLETPDVNEAPATVVEKLIIIADILEIKSDALAAAARIAAKKYVKRLKAELTELIEEYNGTASRYAGMTGEQLTRVSGFLPKYIAEGTGAAVIPRLSYSERYIEINEDDKAANSSYVFVFPNINDIAEGGTLTATPEISSTDGEEENSLAKRVIITSPYTNEELLGTGSVSNIRELKRASKKVRKAYKKLDREIALIEKKHAVAVSESDERESLKMLVEEITVRRQRVEICATLLGYCRDLRVKKLISRVKADMIESMAEYNKSIDKYTAVTGEQLTHAVAYMADEIISGKPAPRLAKLAYYRELVETVGDAVKVIGRKDKKKTLPTTSCTFIFGTTPVVTAGPVINTDASAMPALQAQLVPQANGIGSQPSFAISAAPMPVAAPAEDAMSEPEEKVAADVVVAECEFDEFDEGDLAAMDRREFKRLTSRKEKEIAAYKKKLETHDKAKSRSAGIERSALIIDCIEDLRCIIGTRCEMLEVAVHVNDTKAVNLNKSALLSDISKYNEYVAEYNLYAKDLIPQAAADMVGLIIEGKPYKKLPKIVRKDAKTTTSKVAATEDNSLVKYISANTADIKSKNSEYKKLRARLKHVKGGGQKASLLVQCVNIRVYTVNKLIEQLEKCVSLKNAKYRKSTVKALSAEIKAYNTVAEEYTEISGRPVVLADVKMPRAIVNGKPYARLLTVSDAGILTDRIRDNVAASGKSFADSIRASAVRTETEAKCEEQKKKSVEVITDELDFFVERLYTKRKDLSFNFNGLKVSKRSRISRITKKMEAMERRAAKAVKQEKLDNARYYEALLTDVSALSLKRESDRAELREIQHRIVDLLNLRDEKNAELINHYSGTDKESLKEQKRAHREVRFKAERREFISLRKIDKNLRARYQNGEIDSYKPERIHAAMQDMIEAKGEMAVCSARLKEAGKVKLTKHQCEMVKKELRGWRTKYKEAEKRLKNNLKTNVLSHLVPFGILALVLLAAAIALVLAWPTVSAWLATLGIVI